MKLPTQKNEATEGKDGNEKEDKSHNNQVDQSTIGERQRSPRN